MAACCPSCIDGAEIHSLFPICSHFVYDTGTLS